MMFPITCNAVGDIITLASLVLDITRALNEARGSASEYRVFIAELNTLHILLTSVARVAQDSIDGALRSEILAEIDRCGCHIRYALERIAKFSVLSHDAAASDGLRVKFKRQLYKIEWRFARRSDIQAVRADLSIATQRLTALLIVANADAAAYLHASMSNQFETLAVRMGALASDHYRIAAERDAALSRTVMARGNTEVAGSFQTAAQPDHALVHELFSNAPEGIDAKIAAVAVLCVAVCTVHDTHHVVHTAMLLAAICLLLRSAVRQGRGPVQAIAYTALNSITLNDALGRRLTLPLELCGTYDVFHATLVNLFSSSKGNWFIHAGAYEIADVHSGTVVCREDWHASVRTGAEIEMTVIVHQLSCGSNRSQCPWCLDFVFEGCKSRSHCKACGRAFDTDGGDWTPFSAPTLDDSSSHEQDHTYYATDKGRFPRDRPSHTPILQHGAAFHSSGSSSQTLPGREEDLNPMDQSVMHSDSWYAQVQDFKRVRLRYGRFPLSWVTWNAQSEVHLAAANGHLAVVTSLLDQGIPVDTPDTLGHTALHYAANQGHAHVARLLLDRGADLDAVPIGSDLTPLVCAMARNQRRVTELLLARGALINASVFLHGKPCLLRATATSSGGDTVTAVY